MGVEFVRRRRRSVDVELTPLIDVVFQLLVFFLLTSALMDHAIPVELPEASTGHEAPTVLAISVNREGDIYLDGSPLSLTELRARVREERTQRPDVTVVVAADRRSIHAHFVSVLDVLRQEGISRFGISVQSAPED